MKKIMILGGSGVLGKHLVEYCKKQFNLEVFSPSSDDCNILDKYQLEDNMFAFQPDIVIHAAAFVDTLGCEENIQRAINVNVIGTANVVKCCVDFNCKLIYISSEYVFGGDEGSREYDPYDRLCPVNVYGKTKASSEYLVSIVPKYRIIRVPFIKQRYDEVFSNQYCSRYFVEEISEKIMDNISENKEKIIQISTGERKSLYKHYTDKGVEVKPIKIPKELENIIPKETTLTDNSL